MKARTQVEIVRAILGRYCGAPGLADLRIGMRGTIVEITGEHACVRFYSLPERPVIVPVGCLRPISQHPPPHHAE